MKKRINIVYIIADQLRYDFLGINGNKYIDTPNIDMMAKYGYNFTNAYTSVPSCIAARAAIFTGLKPRNHKRVGYEDAVEWNYENMLPEIFTKNGYNTACVGKMHVYPNRKLCGFNYVDLHDGYLREDRKQYERYSYQYQQSDDYLYWLKDKFGMDADLTSSGLSCNSWMQRAFDLPEYAHPTSWITTRAIDFLRRKDPTKPFYLNISYVAPHSPLNPPTFYYDKYKDRDVKKAHHAKWNFTNDKVYNIDAIYGKLEEKYIINARRAYSGLINHIDDQIRRFLIALDEYGQLNNSIIILSSDHGDMLGDHNFLRKALPYQSSSHIPLIVYDPGNNLSGKAGSLINNVVELRDIKSSLLDFANINDNSYTDGLSIKKLIEKPNSKWREFIQGEHAFGNLSTQFVTNGKKKYIFFTQTGKEQFFDLENDPDEIVDEISNPFYKEDIKIFKDFLIKELTGREEGYVENGRLIVGRKPTNTLK